MELTCTPPCGTNGPIDLPVVAPCYVCPDSPALTAAGLPRVLCDYVDGEVVGSAYVIYGADPAEPPTLTNIATGTAYAVQGVMRPCA